MSLFETYLLVMLADFGQWFQGWSIGLFFFTAAWVLVCVIRNHNTYNCENLWPVFGWVPRMTLVLGILFNVIGIITPSKEKVALIFGGYMVSNIDGIKDIPPNLVKAMNTALEQFSAKKDGEKK